MKYCKYRKQSVRDIYLNEPRVEGSRLCYTWSRNPLLDEDGFWIDYPGLSWDSEHTLSTISPYLSVCMAFAVLPGVRIHLPYALPDSTFDRWCLMISESIRNVYRNEKGIELINGSKPLADEVINPETKTAVLNGGGSEALLTLAKVMDEGERPQVLCFSGPCWSGSDPVKNPHKQIMEKKVCEHFDLELVRVHTSFFELIYGEDWDWREYLKPGIRGIIASSLFLAFAVTATYPLAIKTGISRLISGNEKENGSTPASYTFSQESIRLVHDLHPDIVYDSYLRGMSKSVIVHDLHYVYPNFGVFQYSCLDNVGERWCLKCEKCFRIMLAANIFEIPTSNFGVDPKDVERLLPTMIKSTRNTISEQTSNSWYQDLEMRAREKGNLTAIDWLDRVNRNLLPLKVYNRCNTRRKIVWKQFKSLAWSCVFALGLKSPEAKPKRGIL